VVSVVSGRPVTSTLFPYTTLFRSLFLLCLSSTNHAGFPASSLPKRAPGTGGIFNFVDGCCEKPLNDWCSAVWIKIPAMIISSIRSEEHTSELQSREKLVCRLPLAY